MRWSSDSRRWGGGGGAWRGPKRVLNGAIGLITPPVGTVLNVVAGVGRLRLDDVIRGVTPFLMTYLAILAAFVVFPQIVTAPLAWMR